MSARPITAAPAAPGSPASNAVQPDALLSDGALTALKLVAALLMVGDHVNRFLLSDWSVALYSAGRLVMPIFGILLALNLSRTSALQSGASVRTMRRLLIYGAIATVPYVLLGAPAIGLLPLNILFTLAAAAAVIVCLESDAPHSRWAATGVFVIGGLLAEFWWPALGVVVGVWLMRTHRPKVGLALFVSGMLLLCLINGNAWALASIPVIGLASRFHWQSRWRGRTFFYAFYPLHLALIYVVVLAQRHL